MPFRSKPLLRKGMGGASGKCDDPSTSRPSAPDVVHDFSDLDKTLREMLEAKGEKASVIKSVMALDDDKKQAAEVAQYFGHFDEAEKIYRDMDRRDLALQMRSSLGDWEKVVALVQQGGGDDETLSSSWTKLGDKYFERQQIAKAAQHCQKG